MRSESGANAEWMICNLFNPLAAKSTPRGSLFRLFIKKTLQSEMQNSLTISGFPPHKLVLKVNCTFY
jgi:hypothetical protein